MELTREELLRYNRQIIIPEIGESGQQKLREAKVFVAGIGGLGSISSYYLAAAGIGCLRIVDRDKVDYSNLNRQIIHWTRDIGEWKSVSGSRKLKALNPHCHVEAVQAEITESNCVELIGDCSIIVDALDNMKTRRILNAVSVRTKIPYIYGGVHQLDGMVTTIIPGKTPCMECVFPDDHSESNPAPRNSRACPGSRLMHSVDRSNQNNSGFGRASGEQTAVFLRVRSDIPGIQNLEKS